MKALGLVGWSGSGKTTLLTRLIPALKARGLTISTIKHAHHEATLDQPGKDSHRHLQAGAEEVILANAARFALFSEHRHAPAPDLHGLLSRLAPVDLVLVEGFKTYDFPRIEVFRPALGKPPLWLQTQVLAVASDADVPDCPYPLLDLNAPESLACFIMARLGLHSAPSAQE